MPNLPYEGEQYMARELDREISVRVTAISDLGPGNSGEFGPSDTEAEAIKDLEDGRYWGPLGEESGCMDDRLEGLRIQLAGNRAVTEVLASYMERDGASYPQPEPQSRAFPRKIHELNTMGRPPVFHKGCAALPGQRDALRYADANPDEIIEAAWPILDELGATEFLTKLLMAANIRRGGKRAENETYWDMSAEELLEIAREAGARVEPTHGNHKVAGVLNNMTPYGFDNLAFRSDHLGEDEQPMGMLVNTWAGYRDQLLEDGYGEKEVAEMLMRAVIFNVAIEKMITKDGTPVVSVEADS